MVTLKGEPVILSGNLLREGERASDFELVSFSLDRLSLSTYQGKYKLLNIFPSVGLGVCASSLEKFREKLLQHKEGQPVLIHLSKEMLFSFR